MKIKYIVILAALAVAFAGASLWVILSGGNNARAIKTKFRLGGLMLTVSGMLALTGCEGGAGGAGGLMCYDPVVPESVSFATTDNSIDVSVGDTIEVTINVFRYDSYSYKMFTDKEDVIQSGELEGGNGGTYLITIEPTEYRGDVNIIVYGIKDGEEIGIGGFYLRLE